MGSMIHLAVGRLEVDWGKNHSFADHSMLFQGEADVADVPYYYASDDRKDDSWEVVTKYKQGLLKPLNQVIDRLDLLGHTLEHSRHEYAHLSVLNDFDSCMHRFEELEAALERVDVASLSANYGEGGEDFGNFFRREIAPRIGLNENDWAYSEGMENLSAWTILRLLSKNPSTQKLNVTWAFDDLEQGGWASRDRFVRGLDPRHRILVVTEGSTDATIIRHAFELLRPHIADFFQFVDMEEGYPFSGTGNVFRFVQGLIGISVINDVIVLFDNDAEGIATLRRCEQLKLPPNIFAVKLPDLLELKNFRTIGPTGEAAADINGKAAAVECYLDLSADAAIQWGGYNFEVGKYQGSLVDKQRHMRNFLSQKQRVDSYNYSKMQRVLDVLVGCATTMREAERNKALKQFN